MALGIAMDRRQFGMSVAALGLGRSTLGASAPHVERLQLSQNGWMPNNPRLPVMIYHQALNGNALADQMETAFKRNLWPAQWRNGVYPYHHYHSTAHEVLGIAGGSAQLMLGGEGGHETTVEAGDVLVLPAGTGHCVLQSRPGFLVIGAYPVGQTWDICRAAADQATLERMAKVPYPPSDPVKGAAGPLVHAWPPARA